MYRFLRSKKGFTLVELLIVVFVLGVLTSIAVPLYGAVTRGSRIKACSVQQKEAEIAAKKWCIINGFNQDFEYSISSDGVKGSIANSNNAFSVDQVNLLLNDVHSGEPPFCPSCGTITVKVKGNPIGAVKVTATCDGGDDGDCHKQTK